MLAMAFIPFALSLVPIDAKLLLSIGGSGRRWLEPFNRVGNHVSCEVLHIGVDPDLGIC